MRRLDARNVLAILFVVAGAIPIVVWLGGKLYHSMKLEHVVQIVLVVVMLYFVWWVRKRMEKK
jgi:hypothetical protein